MTVYIFVSKYLNRDLHFFGVRDCTFCLYALYHSILSNYTLVGTYICVHFDDRHQDDYKCMLVLKVHGQINYKILLDLKDLLILVLKIFLFCTYFGK